MRTNIKRGAPLVAAAVGAAIAFAPIAGADTDPSTPYGTNPESPAIYGYHTSNDVANSADSQQDVPF